MCEYGSVVEVWLYVSYEYSIESFVDCNGSTVVEDEELCARMGQSTSEGLGGSPYPSEDLAQDRQFLPISLRVP